MTVISLLPSSSSYLCACTVIALTVRYVERRPSYYLKKIVGFMYPLVLCECTTGLVNPDAIEDRMGHEPGHVHSHCRSQVLVTHTSYTQHTHHTLTTPL